MQFASLADFLGRARMQSVVGMPPGTIENLYLDAVLAACDVSIRVTGAAVDLPDRTEAFFLTVSNFAAEDRWTGPDGTPGWESEDLLIGWARFGADRIWAYPRRVRYFFDPEDRIRGLTSQGPLNSAAAIEFSSEGGATDRIVLYATPEYPCAVELSTVAERCNAILASLQEFVARAVTTTPGIDG